MSIDDIINKYKRAGISDEVIAEKLGVPVEEVRKRWADILRQKITGDAGYGDLVAFFNLLASQYQSLGRSLQILGHILGAVMTPSEMRELIDKDPEVTLQNFATKAIVLQPVRIDKLQNLSVLTDN
jgi:hypothetical protein